VSPPPIGLVNVAPVHVISVAHRTREYVPAVVFGSRSASLDAVAPPALRVEVPSTTVAWTAWTEPWAPEICSWLLVAVTPISEISRELNVMPSIVPVVETPPLGTVALPSRNGWQGAANGWLARSLHPAGDQKRLWIRTYFAPPANPSVHVTTTVTR
jgi:hypothetical protein